MKIVQAGGQTCNQFWIYSNFIADSIENNEKFAIWVPDITHRYFPNLQSSKFISFPLYSETLSRIIGYKRYINFISAIFSNKFAILFFSLFFKIIPKFSFRNVNIGGENSKYRIKHFELIKLIYTPEKSIIDEVDNLFTTVREKLNLIVGIHIRYGDYRTYSNGKYFYTLNEYHAIMQNMISLFHEKKIAFFIASNETINLTSFSDLDCFVLPASFSVKDLYGLSKCDYIIGPPSSFSAWASQYNNVPLYFIENAKNEFSINSFKKINEIWN